MSADPLVSMGIASYMQQAPPLAQLAYEVMYRNVIILIISSPRSPASEWIQLKLYLAHERLRWEKHCEKSFFQFFAVGRKKAKQKPNKFITLVGFFIMPVE